MSRKRVIAVVLVLISLPAALALTDAVNFYVRNRNNGSIISSGERRTYLLYVPRGYDRGRPTPLVISMHGAGGWPVQQMELSGWNRLADRERFIVVYPSAAAQAGPRVWRVEQSASLPRDVRFISDLIDQLQRDYNIDASRIYANGFSNGGGMTFVLSCTLSGRIAAVGMVGAAQTLPWSWCTDAHPMPVMIFHGTADPMVPFNGGKSWNAPEAFPALLAWTANWARRNGCRPEPVDSAVAFDVRRRAYTNCAEHADVVLYTIRGGGHTWPGGKPLPEWFVGPTSRGIDATAQMWAFFRQHRLERR